MASWARATPADGSTAMTRRAACDDAGRDQAEQRPRPRLGWPATSATTMAARPPRTIAIEQRPLAQPLDPDQGVGERTRRPGRPWRPRARAATAQDVRQRRQRDTGGDDAPAR